MRSAKARCFSVNFDRGAPLFRQAIGSQRHHHAARRASRIDVAASSDDIETGKATDVTETSGCKAFQEAAALRDREGAADDRMGDGGDRLARKTARLNDGVQEVPDPCPHVHRHERECHGSYGIDDGSSRRQGHSSRRCNTGRGRDCARRDLDEGPSYLGVEDGPEDADDGVEQPGEEVAGLVGER